MGKDVEAIMLSKTYKTDKDIIFPSVVTEKLDGVACDFYYKRKLGQVHNRTRQNEELLSVDHIAKWLNHKLPDGAHLLVELYIPGKPFKEISGLVRRKHAEPSLLGYVFDYYIEGQEDMPYYERMGRMYKALFSNGRTTEERFGISGPVRMIPGTYVPDQKSWSEFFRDFTNKNPTAEGVVIRSVTGPTSVFKKGWRSPGMLKRKITETVDLTVHSFEEAIDKHGNKKGMVGRINVMYHSGASDGKNEFTDFAIIGAGPGKLTHKERIDVWENQEEYIGKIAEIAYMPDPSYDALREPRFYRWRKDKTKPNQE